MGNESISTQFDELLSSLKRAEGSPLPVQELADQCNMSEKDVVKWLHVLEKSGRVQLENRIEGVYAHWAGPDKSESRHMAKAAENIADIDIARGREKSRGRAPEVREMGEEPKARKIKLRVDAADMEVAQVGQQLEAIEAMIAKLREHQAKKAKLEKEAAIRDLSRQREEKAAAEKKAEELYLREKREKEAKAEESAPLSADDSSLILTQNIPKENKIQELGPEPKPMKPQPLQIAKGQPETAKQEGKLQPIVAITPLETLPQSAAAKIPAQHYSGQKKQEREQIRRPQHVHMAPQSLEFSERLSQQVKRIIDQTQEMEKLRLEKERILKEHYLPMQRKLDIEIETISDRVLRMEKGILSMQERAAQLPGKVSATEKLQAASVKAHREMRRTYDEASALIEESNRELAEEREKMQVIIDQSRQEIAEHTAKREELERSLSRLGEMEEDAERRVIGARGALAEQAERLSAAENFLSELSSLKDEIAGSVGELRQEISTTKGLLTGIQKQMEQMRQVELWAESIRQDYDTKMADLDDYIRHGNQEFDNLRESVETNFVRRYLRELRQLTDSYSFEFGQAQQMEKGIDERISEERGKLEGLLEEGRKISQLYEMQAKETPGSEKFEERGEMFRSLSQVASEREQIEQMIAQIVGKKTELEQKISAPKAKVSSVPIKAHRKAKAAKKKTHKKGKKR